MINGFTKTNFDDGGFLTPRNQLLYLVVVNQIQHEPLSKQILPHNNQNISVGWFPLFLKKQHLPLVVQFGLEMLSLFEMSFFNTKQANIVKFIFKLGDDLFGDNIVCFTKYVRISSIVQFL